jgi:predicted MPP superfamily phosphohydrolase
MGTIVPMGSTVTKWMEDEVAANPGYNLTLHCGDLAYAGLSTQGGEWEPTWDAWMAQIAPLASVMPYVTPVGNHERFFNYSSFLHRFQMPSAGSKGRTNFWWSFDFESIHFTSISTEDDLSVGSEQYEWLVNDFVGSASNPSTKWLILLCHRPLYSSDVSEESTHVPGSVFLRSLEPLMQKFRVDLVLTGHMHMSAYERSTRARRQREWSRWQRGRRVHLALFGSGSADD